MADIQMPQLGETVTEGTITRWFKQVGDQIAEDEPLFEVSTDKVDSEVPSPVSGYLTEIKVDEGDTVDVGTVLAVVSDSPDGAGDAGGGDTAQAEARKAGAAAEVAEQVESAEQGHEQREQEAAEADARTEPDQPLSESSERTPEESPEALEEVGEPDAAAEDQGAAGSTGAAAGAGAAPQSVPPSAGPEPSVAPAGSGAAQVLSPVVRRLIAEHHLDPATIAGTGAGGRITRADVLKVVEGSAPAPAGGPPVAAPPPAPPVGPAASRQPAVAVPRAGEHDTAVPLNNIRRRTAEHMVRSKATSPHVLTVMEVDYEAVESARRAFRDAFKQQEGFSLTYLPFIARALIDAIDEFPFLNATVGEGELIVHGDVNLGIAVDLSYEGLIVPVIHAAQDKRLRAIAREIHDLASRARSKKLSADDITGGTVTITNAGQYGTYVQMAVINQPQVMILSTEGVARKPVVVTDAAGNEAIAIHSVGNLSMAWDHRAFDGAYAAAFLRRVCEILETRDWEAEL
ncbi:MAG: 2-oxo acid dehydrogenase subunit E2 [Actinobacteria bacterium]|nr:2-oxo acid dehydrogenase subunit E2 [Actinomycetota bacterium]